MTRFVRPIPSPLPLRRMDPASWMHGPLEWSQLRWNRSEWVLRAGAEAIGTLTVRGVFRERSVGRGPSGDWEFGARWTGETWISPAGSADVVARYRPGAWGGGEISTASALRYEWKRSGFWRGTYAISNDSGFPCVRFGPRSSIWRMTGEVIVDPPGERVPELEALVLLGWRLVIAAGSHAH
jgi:hypothetical protein